MDVSQIYNDDLLLQNPATKFFHFYILKEKIHVIILKLVEKAFPVKNRNKKKRGGERKEQKGKETDRNFFILIRTLTKY